MTVERYVPVVVVVDDDESHRLLVQRWVERGGFRAVGYPDGASCVAETQAVLPDAVLLDLHMSGLGGLQTLDRLVRSHPHLPVIMLTADTNVPSAVRAIQGGAFDYLTKPVNRRKLLSTVRRAVERNERAAQLRQLERDAAGGGYGAIIGSSPPMKRLFKQLDRVAPSDVTVLITGQSGTGKELVARAIHSHSGRSGGSFVAINCAAIPEGLQESELFGHERGAFTGAERKRTGRFEQANHGTLFLDEVGELSPALQAKLLRVLQERTFYRVGGSEEIEVDVRIVTATYRDLADCCRRGDFREDLFYRLAVFELELPALRERPDDIPLLVEHFVAEFAQRHGRRPLPVSREAMVALNRYAWPGNVRELQNAVERALVAALGGSIEVEDLPRRIRDQLRSGTHRVASIVGAPVAARGQADLQPMEELEKSAIQEAILAANGNMSEVIRKLGIPRTTLYRKLKKYQLR